MCGFWRSRKQEHRFVEIYLNLRFAGSSQVKNICPRVSNASLHDATTVVTAPSAYRQACDSPSAARAHKRTHNISALGDRES
jgi:hypothetical protein